jgi:four helix bundle protein
MSQENQKITSFTKFYAWQEGHKLVLHIYKITRRFPPEELYGLGLQMKRSSVSVTSNIAEGFGRKSYPEKIQFYHIALGSLTELQNQIIIARDIALVENIECNELVSQAIVTNKILNGLIKKTKQLASSAS